jgi:hypothetical protein
MINGVINALIILLVVFYTVEDQWIAACLVYANVIIVVTLRVA